MKRTFLLAALLAASRRRPARRPPAPPTTRTPDHSPTPTPRTPTPAARPSPKRTHIAREKQVVRRLKAKNWDAFAAMLADDSSRRRPTACRTRPRRSRASTKLRARRSSRSPTSSSSMDGDLVRPHLHGDREGHSTGKPLPPKAPHRDSTAWVNRGGKWLVVYHQETEVIETPPPRRRRPPPRPPRRRRPRRPRSPAATPAATPATDRRRSPSGTRSSARTTTPSPRYLAADALEVEPEGVYRQGAVGQGVKQFDFIGVDAQRLQGDEARRRRHARHLHGQGAARGLNTRARATDHLGQPRRPMARRLPPGHAAQVSSEQ